MQSEKSVVINRVETSGPSAGEATKKSPELSQSKLAEGPGLVIKCDGCKRQFELVTLRKKDIGQGLVLVSLVCPHCQFEASCYYTNPDLEKGRKQLNRLKATAHTSERARRHYEKEFLKFQVKHKKVQEIAKLSLSKLVNST